ncbi:internal scaffolding protein [Blackfly microvirus SF02]|uniref:Internal scaffolding protein n=1 Tax=Blackfly microvirus SF02 TaxID=2576452 RepID=A0A4P8PKF5_9VIRU|nr:internal scaffolding protein [Blackfly microvirus SF02]
MGRSLMLRQGLNSNGEFVRDFFVEHDPVDAPYADDGMTRQEFAAECDINTLMSQYERTGVMDHFNRREPVYLDLLDMPDDLLATMSMVQAAESSFMALPARVRKEFDNDPFKFVAYAEDPANLSRLREWGLAPPEKPVDAPKTYGTPHEVGTSDKAKPEGSSPNTVLGSG